MAGLAEEKLAQARRHEFESDRALRDLSEQLEAAEQKGTEFEATKVRGRRNFSVKSFFFFFSFYIWFSNLYACMFLSAQKNGGLYVLLYYYF